MLARERLYKITEYMKEHKRARVDELAEYLDVSLVTVRTDLQKLQRRSIVEKVHGGAVITDHFMPEFNFDEKSIQNFDAKERIAAVCLELIKDGDTLILDTGTTTLQVAKLLKNRTGLQVITNSLPIVTEIMNAPKIKITVLGGELRPVSLSMTGAFTLEELEKIRVSKAFIGAMGIDSKVGFTSSNPLEAQAKQKMIACARETFIIADSSKMGKVALFPFAKLEEVTKLITDKGARPDAIKELRKKGLKVIIAK